MKEREGKRVETEKKGGREGVGGMEREEDREREWLCPF